MMIQWMTDFAYEILDMLDNHKHLNDRFFSAANVDLKREG